MTYWRSTHGHEVDFVIGDTTAIEVKATRRVLPADMKGLRYLEEEGKVKRFILVSQDPIHTRRGPIEAMHWESFLSARWDDRILLEKQA